MNIDHHIVRLFIHFQNYRLSVKNYNVKLLPYFTNCISIYKYYLTITFLYIKIYFIITLSLCFYLIKFLRRRKKL